MKPDCKTCENPCALAGGDRPVPMECVPRSPRRISRAREFTLSQLSEYERALDFDGLVRPPGVDNSQWDTMRHAIGAAETFAGKPAHRWLLLMGPTGVGKTHLLAAITNDLLKHGTDAVYVHIGTMQRVLRDSIGRGETTSITDMLARTRVLLLDDLGVEQATPWMMAWLDELVNDRYKRREQAPTAVTSNLTLDGLGERYPRIASRLDDRRLVMHRTIVMPDYRRNG